MRGVAQFTIADRRALAGGFARFERGERAVFFGGAIEHLEQRLVAEGRARPASRMEVELRKDMAAEAGQMNIDPVTGPVDFFGGIGMTLDIGGRKRFVERADIVAVKGVDQLLDIRAINLDQRTGEFGIFREAVDLLRDLARWYRLAARQRFGEGGAMFQEFRQRLAHQLVGALRDDDRFEMRRELTHRTTALAIFAAVAEAGQLDQTAHRERIPVRRAELVNRLMSLEQERAEDGYHCLRREVDRHDVEDQFALGRVEAIALSSEIRERRAGVDALVPPGERIAERAFDYGGAHDGRDNRIARREHELLAEALGVAVSIGPSPTQCAIAANFLEPLFHPPLAHRFENVIAPFARIGVFIGARRAEFRLARLVMRFRFDPIDGRERVANFAPRVEIAPAIGTPVDRYVVFEAMAVGAAGRVAGRYVEQRRASLAAKFDHVGDTSRVNRDRLLERRLEIHQSRAVNHGVELVVADRVGGIGDEIRFCDIAGDDLDFFLDVAVEARAEMLAQRRHRGRIENFAPEAVEARAPVAANQKEDALDFGMVPQQQVEQHLAEEAGRAGEHDAALAQHLGERRHRIRRTGQTVALAVAVPVAAAVAVSVATDTVSVATDTVAMPVAGTNVVIRHRQ